jgi:hypothetical protein
MPEMTRRSSTRRAPGWFFGKCGSIADQASSDNQTTIAISSYQGSEMLTHQALEMLKRRTGLTIAH